MSVQTSPPPTAENARRANDAAFETAQEEDRVASAKVVAVFGAAVAITIAAVWIQSRLLDAKRSEIGAKHDNAALVAPRQIEGIHQTLLERDRHGLELRAEQRAALDRWSWIDRDHALARIPIERAMELLVTHPELAAPDAATSASASASASTSGGAP